MQSRCWHCKREETLKLHDLPLQQQAFASDLPEAAPRLALLNKSDIEAARLQWFAAVLDSKRVVPDASQPVLSVDPLMRRNIDLLKRTAEGNPRSNRKYRNKPVDRLLLLGDCARMRLEERSEEALSMLESFIKQHEDDPKLPTTTWTQGYVVAALLHLDANRPNTAVRIGRELRTKEPRHPHVRSLIRILNELGLLDVMATEPTKMTMRSILKEIGSGIGLFYTLSMFLLVWVLPKQKSMRVGRMHGLFIQRSNLFQTIT